MERKACVLYVDHQGHPAPLSRCYHATASRRLSSSVDRHLPSTKTEVDSAYCPQCLTFHDAATAASLGYCETCKQCPLCLAVASVTVDDDCTAFYKCGYCEWTSQDCQVTATVTSDDNGSISKEQMLQATKDLAASLGAKMDESVAEAHYRDQLASWETILKDQRAPRPEKIKRGGVGLKLKTSWSLEALEELLQTKQEKNHMSMIGNAQRLSIDNQPQTQDTDLASQSPTSLLLQPTVSSTNSPVSVKEMLPLPMPLRPRKSRRCRAELAEGRPGILVKPKLNPLEGDTSLRSGHGQWWKKDSSAIHVVPKIRVVKSTKSNFLFKVSNPTMSIVRLRLTSSTYEGEGGGNSVMKHVLMDSLNVSYADLCLNRQAMSGLKATEMVVLESVEDAFLELGKASREVPDAVAKWTPSSHEEDSSFIRLVAARNDVAWFELAVSENQDSDGSNNHSDDVWMTVPIAMQIQVGEGSWESSLIKSIMSSDEGPDLVTFDVLIAYQTNDSKDYIV